VKPGGTTEGTAVVEGPADSARATCLVDMVKHLTFPRAKQPLEVVFPFRFE
jgi:hypothetical protein